MGRETILRDGEAVGYLTSGGWGYTLGQALTSVAKKQPCLIHSKVVADSHV